MELVEFRWRDVAESRVRSANVVEPFDEAEDVTPPHHPLSRSATSRSAAQHHALGVTYHMASFILDAGMPDCISPTRRTGHWRVIEAPGKDVLSFFVDHMRPWANPLLWRGQVCLTQVAEMKITT